MSDLVNELMELIDSDRSGEIKMNEWVEKVLAVVDILTLILP